MSLRVVAGWAGDAVTGLVIALAGAVFAVLAWPMPRGDVGNPGTGFLPFVLGLLLVLLGLACALRALRTRDGQAAVALGGRKTLICILALAGAVLAFIPLGFLPTTAIFLTVLFATLAGISWPRAALSALAASVVLWLVFQTALGLGLPAGVMPLW